MHHFHLRYCTLTLLITTTALSLLFLACSPSSEREYDLQRDVHSFANSDEVVTEHLELDVAVDFQRKQIRGSATFRLRNTTGTDRLYLDTRDLIVHRVTLGIDGQETSFMLGDPVEHLGQPLIITISPEADIVTIHYTTSPNATAVQWLEPAQTAGRRKPFMYTQSQAIHARSWVPCQDSPGVRMTYRARVAVPPDLLALMSASNPIAKDAEGVYEFDMPQPIPAYLLALAVGDIEFRALGPRTGVYAEPTVIEKAAWEFADTERMMEVAEALYGPYRWERYDILVLPPSFPFGGMENPRLTFATPTILAGDRSLTALVAHELAHSWSGNLVTNATWNDFWLNEGFTTYFENRIMEALYGRKYSEMLAHLKYQDLVKTVGELGEKHPDTHLHLDLKGRDPDDGMTDIAYNKGHFLLRMIEENVGRERWDAFLRQYFDTFAFQTMTSHRFVNYLRENLIKGDRELERKLRIDEWVFGPGIPENCPEVVSNEFARVEAELESWMEGKATKELNTKEWTTHHWRHFLRNLPTSMTSQQMAELDSAFGFTKSGNSEVLAAWLEHAIATNYTAAFPALEEFLTGMGRRKFLRPLYAKLAETPAGLQLARRIYERARPLYHSISTVTIDGILNWKDGG